MPSKRRQLLLSNTRPPLNHSRPTVSKTLSSNFTRTIIRNHHTLQKRLASAISIGDTQLITSLRAQIEANGGLTLYQRASIQGQSPERGGDSGVVLKRWIGEQYEPSENAEIRMLEVGALKVDGVCSRTPYFSVERIDLRSQHPEIKTQDFMQRPLPSTPAEYFDIVSLSLVLNYVGTPLGRGEMLLRVEKYLRRRKIHGSVGNDLQEGAMASRSGQGANQLLPSLFLVLPAPCVTNSRYLNEDKLEAMLNSIGYEMARKKLSAKLIYYLFRLVQGHEASLNTKGQQWKKEEIRKGGKRNNFAIVF
ncbi:hypothetical protein MMC31_007415 [Peltigera leucophlebia]|nr:hypothetical protein [Peltigera leucophlebia]